MAKSVVWGKMQKTNHWTHDPTAVVVTVASSDLVGAAKVVSAELVDVAIVVLVKLVGVTTVVSAEVLANLKKTHFATCAR